MDCTLSRAEVDAWAGRLYPRALRGEPRRELLGDFCRSLAERTGAALVTLARAGDSGILVVEAQSGHGTLWVDLQRVPERWDESIAAAGAGCAALQADAPVTLASADPRLLVWRNALENERVERVLAIPLCASGGRRVLQLYLHAEQEALAPAAMREVVKTLQTLLDDFAHLDRNELLACALESAGEGAFVTDLEGSIVWCNGAFTRLTGYQPADVLGRNPRMLSSGQQSVRYYRELWNAIRSGKVWSGETVDRDRAGRLYTVQQTVSPVARRGQVTHYLSLHRDISRNRAMSQEEERRAAIDPVSGLLTPAAFDQSAARELAAAAQGRQCATLVLVSSSALRSTLATTTPDLALALRALLGAALRDALPAPTLACAAGPGDYLFLVPDHDVAACERIVESLLEALRGTQAGVPGPCDDAVASLACFPEHGASIDALRLHAEAQHAAPLVRARRQAAGRLSP